MTNPFKTQGWNQGLYEQSATKKEFLGTLRFTEDGRAFRYAKAGGTIAMGKNCIMAVTTANHIKQANTGYTMAVGAVQVSVLLGATACTANQYDDGYLQIYDGASTAVGQQCLIASHTISAAGSEAITLTLAEPIRAACIATDSYSLIPNPWNGVTHAATVANGNAGLAPIAVTSGYYFWLQTGGVGCGLCHANTALGSEITLSATDTGGYDVAAGYTSGFVGTTIGFAAIADKYNPLFLGIY